MLTFNQALQEENDDLNTLNTLLLSDNESLETEVNATKNLLVECQTQLSELIDDYKKASSSLTELQAQYDDLLEAFNELLGMSE